jgi:hypothetical protein
MLNRQWMTSTPARSLQGSLAQLGYKREGPCITTQSAGDPLVPRTIKHSWRLFEWAAMASDTCPNWQPRPSSSRRLMFALYTVPRTLVQNPFAIEAAAHSLNLFLETTSTPPVVITKSSITKSLIAAGLGAFQTRSQDSSTILTEFIVLTRPFHRLSRKSATPAEALWMRDSRYRHGVPGFQRNAGITSDAKSSRCV